MSQDETSASTATGRQRTLQQGWSPMTMDGVSCYKPDVDDDGIDVGFATRATGRARLEAQLKCSERELLHEDGIHFPLPKHNYDQLRLLDVDVPRILIVVLVPDDVSRWLTFESDHLVLRRCAWWVSLAGALENDNTTSVTVTVPLAQRFDREALAALMTRSSAGAA